MSLMEDDNFERKKALIYCRVSSKKQKIGGSGLDSQEYRCRQYAAAKNYEVEEVFPDDITGGGDFMKRPGMVALLRYLDSNPGENYVVIFDDLKRYSRDTEFHLRLRREMQARNATRECLNFNFEDSPEGKFFETIVAATGTLEREQNGRQVVQKMKARVEQGFWVFRAPVGYRYEKSARGGKELVRDEPLASIVQEALEGFASGRFATQTEVKRFLESQPEYPKDTSAGYIRHFTITRFLNKAVYAGYVEAPEWKVSRRKGNHEGLISFATFQKIQTRLKETAYAPARKDIRDDFPLRGFVACGECGRPLTAGWCKGKYKKYPYYFCQNRDCSSYGKSLKRDRIEGEFEDILKSLTPTENLFRIARAMFEDAWKQKASQTGQIRKALRTELTQIDKRIEDLVERIVETTSAVAIKAYERKIAQLEDDRLLAAERLQKSVKTKATLGEIIELSYQFLSNPWKLWVSGDLRLRKMILRLVFSEALPYDREKGYRTPKTTLPFKVLEGLRKGKNEMVLRVRIELTTSPLPRECSTTELPQR